MVILDEESYMHSVCLEKGDFFFVYIKLKFRVMERDERLPALITFHVLLCALLARPRGSCLSMIFLGMFA